jgi:phage gp46-like protein
MYKNAYNTVIYNASAVLSFANFYLQWLGDYNAESVSDQGDPPGANSIINLPSSAFKNYAGGDYTLSGTTSELYHAGSSAYAPELDNNGVPFDALTPSIGAFEFIPTPQTATPPAFELGTFKPQQGDISLFQTDDGGDITALDGIVTMGGGLETAVYLSLFGGNEDDDGRQDSPADWWGNIDETDPAREYHSETQHLLRSLPATTGNLRRLEDAARRDLSWLESDSVASSVTVSASIPGVNKIKLEIDIEAIGEESSFEYVENWKADA